MSVHRTIASYVDKLIIGKTLKQVSEKTGMSTTRVHRILKNDYQNIKLTEVSAIIAAYGGDLVTLFTPEVNLENAPSM